jgi:Sec-independent protein secretion pathway component TatC
MNEPSPHHAPMTFWDHLDELRSELFRIAVAVVG